MISRTASYAGRIYFSLNWSCEERRDGLMFLVDRISELLFCCVPGMKSLWPVSLEHHNAKLHDSDLLQPTPRGSSEIKLEMAH